MLCIVFLEFSFPDVPPVSGETGIGQVQLTEKERAWLEAHPIIRLAPDPKFQPIEFFDAKGNYAGIGADYAKLISNKLGFKFEIVKCANWNDVLARMKRREVDVLNAVVKTPQREKYLLFPTPYLKIPSVIIVRKNVTSALTLGQLKGLDVVMVSGYGYVDLIRNKYPGMKIELVSDLKSALRKVSFGMADAFVGDLATASFYIETEGITNLKLAGESDPPNISGFAVRSDWPEFSHILEKGVALLTEKEREAIFNKWIHLETERGITMSKFKRLMVFIAGFVFLVIAGFILWNRQLKRTVNIRTESLSKEVSERKRAQEALEEREVYLETLIETIPDLVWLKDPQGVFLACNRKFEQFFGAEQQDIVGKTDFDFVDKELAEFFRLHDKKAMAAGRPTVNEEEVTFASDGHHEYLETIKTPLTGKDGALIGVLGVARDITERKKSENEIKESHERLLAILDSLEAVVYVSDFDTYEILYANKYFTEIFGEVAGKICWKVIQGEQAGPCDFCTNSKLLDVNGEPTGTYVWEFQNTTNGRWYYIHDRAIKWVDGRYVRMEIATDITEKKNAEEEKFKLQKRLQQAQKMEAIGTLAGGIAHDFNNILGAILGYAEMAKEDAPAGSTIENDLKEVLVSANRAKDLVRQILAFSRQAESDRIPMNIQPLIKEALKMLRSSIPTTISITEDIDPKCGSIMADPTQIHQIMLNLCTNAYHAMEDTGGTMTVSLKTFQADQESKSLHLAAGEYIALSVADTGTGIGPDMIDKVFDPYFTTKEIGKGTGMGLAIIHGIVSDYGGEVTVESQLGRGTTFHVYLPVVEKEAEPETTKQAAVLPGTERILFIDDEEILAKMGRDILERLGYNVTVRHSSFEALESFQNTPDEFDLVITDQTMPGMTGADLSRRMLQIRPDIPIILCTGYSNIIDEDSAKALGIKEFAYKPLTKETIANLIRKVLDTS